MLTRGQNTTTNWRGQRGSTTTEFVLVAPLLTAAMLFLIGLGYTLMTKQNAIVGARAAVFYRASMPDEPSVAALADTVKESVSPDREAWEVLDLADDLETDPDLGNVGQSNPDLGAFDIIQGTINSLYQTLNHEVGYRVSTTPTLGFVPHALRFDRSVQARSAYYLPLGTWTCEQSGGGSYLTMAMTRFNVPKAVIKIFDPGCCETYQSTR
jgi:TadE-like protein